MIESYVIGESLWIITEGDCTIRHRRNSSTGKWEVMHKIDMSRDEMKLLANNITMDLTKDTEYDSISAEEQE